MSTAKMCPFVLSLDAIINLEAVFSKLSTVYRAAPDSDHKQFRPEFHLPTQLFVHAYGDSSVNNYGRPANLDFVNRILADHVFERTSTNDGDICYGLKNPFIRLVHDSAHGIARDPSLYGDRFIPTQLVLAHAARLAKLAAKDQAPSQSFPNQQETLNRLNVVIVTSFGATISAARAEGYQVWNYTEPKASDTALSPYEFLLLKLSLVEFDNSTDPPVPKVYRGISLKKSPRGAKNAPVPPPYAEEAPGWPTLD
ncbi:hypothetical protein IJI00_00215 [Candidatus Saccharibacteria bacterium]|nr:hypothetical protein [Candidatus Saccharibacteria bacterium]